MEREDPLERLARKEQEKKEGKPANALLAIMIVAIVAALGLAAALFVNVNKNKDLVSNLNAEKEDLTEQIQALQADYEQLSSDYDVINAQLDSSREEIAQLVDRVKKTQATDRAKMRQYEKELGTLRTIMRSYIVQIDSLNNLNHKLTAEAANARKEAATQRKLNEELTSQVENLSGRVATGAIIKARGVRIDAYGAGDKATDKANKVVRMLVTLSLIENELAERGPVRVYVRVTDPNGNLLSDGSNASFSYNGSAMNATASREVDYEGREVDLGIYVNNIELFEKGIYTVQAYTTQAMLGSAELMLR